MGPTHPAGPVEEQVQLLEFFGTKGFTQVGGTLFRTDDFGENWVRLDKQPDSMSVQYMAMQGPFLFAGTWTGVFRSGDGGESWTKLPPIPSVTTVQAMFVHREGLLISCQASSGAAVYRYSESALAWTPLVVQAPNASIHQVKLFAADDSALYIGGNGLFKSLDGGTTWMDLKTGLYEARKLHQSSNPSGSLLSLLAGNGGLFAGVEGAVYRSADGGSTWSPMLIRGWDSFSTLALSGDTLLAGSSPPGGLWRFPLDLSPPSRIDGFESGVRHLCASDSGVFAGRYNGILRTVDGGKTWNTKNPGIRTWDIGILTSKNGVMHAGGRGSPLFRSLDRGVTWVLNTDLPELKWIKSMTWNENTLFAVSGQGTNDLYASEDGGTDWTRLNGDSDSLEFEMVAASAGTLYAAALDTRTGAYVLHRSEDNGLSWKPASDPILSGRVGINSLAFGGSWIHAGTDSGCFRIDAATGKVDAARLSGESIRKMFALEGRLFASGVGTALWRTLDQGLTWEKTAVSVPWVENVTAFAGHDQTVYAGTYGSGVYRSTNGGSSWEPFNSGKWDPQVTSLVLDGRRLYAGTSASVYSLVVEGTSSFSGGRMQRGKSGIRTESLLGKGMRIYLETLPGNGRYRIIGLDGRQVGERSIGPNDGANR
jgi:photosystem II stability/assembly factor-like uncharacterized protein